MVLTTAGPLGLYTAGYTDDSEKRETSHALLPGAIPEFNRYEFSRPKRRRDCDEPIKVYAHISPYMGGPEKFVIPMVPVMVLYLRYCMIWHQTIIIAPMCQVQVNIRTMACVTARFHKSANMQTA